LNCWNCDKLNPPLYIEIFKDYELGPKGTYIEVSLGRPHNFKKCWKQLQILLGKWTEHEKKEVEYVPPYIEYAGLWEWPARFKEQIDHLRRNN
jgi:hypothetical protein